MVNGELVNAGMRPSMGIGSGWSCRVGMFNSMGMLPAPAELEWQSASMDADVRPAVRPALVCLRVLTSGSGFAAGAG